jgi:hypothetical protein
LLKAPLRTRWELKTLDFKNPYRVCLPILRWDFILCTNRA